MIEPVGLLHGQLADDLVSRGEAVPLAQTGLAFQSQRMAAPQADGAAALASFDSLAPDARALFAAPRAPWCGLSLERPRVMAILNVTPDSFSDGWLRFRPEAAIAAGQAMIEAGADLIDIGGESTRPGATEVDPEEEQRRVLPVIAALAKLIPVSIDTRHAATMQAALAAGACAVNDVSGLTFDPLALDVAAQAGCDVVLCHMRGTPADMAEHAQYADVTRAVVDALAERVAACQSAGIARARIAVDPGIGFAKTAAHNFEILDRLAALHGLGCAVLVGASRKGFIGVASGERDPRRRLAGSLAAALTAVARGAQILRVHDVAETVQALAVWRAIARAGA